MKYTLVCLLSLFFLIPTQVGFTQCSGQVCPSGPPEGAICAEFACVSCDITNLDGYEGMTELMPNTCDVPGPFCGSVENNQWFGFVAPLESVTFSFEVSDCLGQQNGAGIQAEVYATNDCNNFTSVSNCWSPGAEVSGSVTALDLVVGNTYYLMVDGWANDICNYVISVDSASLAAPPSSIPSFSGPTLNCPNTVSEYITNSGCLFDFQWSFDGNGTLVIGVDSSHAFIEWGAPAEGILCLSATTLNGTPLDTCVEMSELVLEPTTLTTNPPPSSPGITEICLGDDIAFFSSNPFLGEPNDSLLHFEWSFGDGNFEQGSGYHIYEVPGEFEVQLFVYLEGCDMRDTLTHLVRVVPLPSANISGIPTEGICPGTEVNLTIDQIPNEFKVNPLLFERQIFPTPLALPDGVDSSLTPELQIIGADPGDTLSTVENFQICVNMEHSWMRDLEISLTCPSGQSVLLHNHPGQTGGEVNLGVPFENDEGLPEPIPGTGYNYCWTTSSSNGTWIEYANSTGVNTLPPGDYSSFEPLENFIGCAIDGEWTLTLTDLWEIDNGHLFSATIIIDNPSSDSLSVPNTGEWLPNFSIVFSDEDSLAAVPSTSTTYIYSLTNGFGCSTEIEVPVEVNDDSPFCFPCSNLSVSINNNIEITCESPFPTAVGTSTPYPIDSLVYTWTQDGSVVSDESYLWVEEIGEYIVTVEYPLLGCIASDTLLFIQNNDPPIADAGPNINLSNCPNPTAILDGSASSTGPSIEYLWENSDGQFVSNEINPTIDEPGIYTLIVTDTENDCSSTDSMEVFQGPPVNVLIETTPDSCGLSIGTATATLTPPQANSTYLWDNGSMEEMATGLAYGPHSVSVQWANCPDLSFNFLVDSVACATTSIKEIIGLESMEVFPNPTQEKITLSFELAQKENLEFAIFNVLGQEVQHHDSQLFSRGKNVIEFDLKNISSGNYLLVIKSENHFRAMRIMKI